MAQLEHVTLTPNPVLAGEQYIVSVAVLTWGYLNKNFTWDELSGQTWDEVKSRWQEDK